MSKETIDDMFAGLTQPEGEVRGWTVREIAAAKGWSDNRVREELRRADTAGILRVGRKPCRRLDGCATVVPCYWTETPPAAAKRKGT